MRRHGKPDATRPRKLRSGRRSQIAGVRRKVRSPPSAHPAARTRRGRILVHVAHAPDRGFAPRSSVRLACFGGQSWPDHRLPRCSGRRPLGMAAGASGKRRGSDRPAHSPRGWNSGRSAEAVSLPDRRLPHPRRRRSRRGCRLEVTRGGRRNPETRSCAAEGADGRSPTQH